MEPASNRPPKGTHAVRQGHGGRGNRVFAREAWRPYSSACPSTCHGAGHGDKAGHPTPGAHSTPHASRHPKLAPLKGHHETLKRQPKEPELVCALVKALEKSHARTRSPHQALPTARRQQPGKAPPQDETQPRQEVYRCSEHTGHSPRGTRRQTGVVGTELVGQNVQISDGQQE